MTSKFNRSGNYLRVIVIVVTIIVTLNANAPMTEAKILTNCQVANELKRMNVQRSYISNCISNNSNYKKNVHL